MAKTLMDMGISLKDTERRSQNPEDKCKQYVKKKLVNVDTWHPKDEGRAGIPDARYIGTCRASWVEYKYLRELPSRDTTLVTPKWNSELQLRTCNDFHRVGDRVLVVLFHGDCSDVRNTLVYVFKDPDTWTNGVPAATVRQQSITIAEYITRLNNMVNSEGRKK